MASSTRCNLGQDPIPLRRPRAVTLCRNRPVLDMRPRLVQISIVGIVSRQTIISCGVSDGIRHHAATTDLLED